jgi:iron complex outermembrane receptor protein
MSEYDVPLPSMSGIDGFIRGLYSFYGRNPHVDGIFVAPSYGLLNLYAGLHSSDGAWEAALFAKNALNTQKTIDIAYSAGQINTAGVSALFGPSGYYDSTTGPMVTPRAEYGLTITYSVGSR